MLVDHPHVSPGREGIQIKYVTCKSLPIMKMIYGIKRNNAQDLIYGIKRYNAQDYDLHLLLDKLELTSTFRGLKAAMQIKSQVKITD